ncbi:MAG: DUF3307 domain-containing protein [Flavobacteriaceae bacterium]|nr:DUF3307 domain-containing protein [Flavobacteriaceae bacterium]
MECTHLLIVQFIAHILTDYTFQNEKNAKDKNEKGFKSKFLKWHILTLFLTSWLLSFQLKFIFASLLIAITHWVIDGFKPKLNQNKLLGKYAFFIDQFLHLAILLVVVIIFSNKFGIDSYLNFQINIKFLLIFTVFLITTKPSNILIREVFKLFEIKMDTTKNDELLRAGRLIGILERWLILIFVLIGQFSAVGFLIAAKSILRYSPKNEDGFNKTEYVLIGTMLSFGIAIAISVLITYVKC